MNNIQNIYKKPFGRIDITVKCPFCGSVSQIINICEHAFTEYLDGKLVQRAFPEMSANDRELLITGMCYSCQEKVFKDNKD